MSIASELSTLAANKAAIKAAIEAQNPSIPPTDSLAQWPTSIASIGGSAPVPYDEVVDYITMPDNGNIVVNTQMTDRVQYLSMEIRLQSGLTQANGNRFYCGNWDSTNQTYGSIQIYSTNNSTMGFFNYSVAGESSSAGYSSVVEQFGFAGVCFNALFCGRRRIETNPSYSGNTTTVSRSFSIGYGGSKSFDIRSFEYQSQGVKISCIPVRVGQVGALYDTVSGTLYENSGSGTITPVPFSS